MTYVNKKKKTSVEERRKTSLIVLIQFGIDTTGTFRLSEGFVPVNVCHFCGLNETNKSFYLTCLKIEGKCSLITTGQIQSEWCRISESIGGIFILS